MSKTIKENPEWDLFIKDPDLDSYYKKLFPHNGGMEIIDCDPIYQRKLFTSGLTTELVFFTEAFRHLSDGNMYIGGMLPQPQAFLVEKIQIDGVTSQLRHAACQLIISSKVYAVLPAWTLALKNKGLILKKKLFIPPLTAFHFRMLWPLPVYLGRGLDGVPELYHPLTVVLFGQRARPVC